MMRWATCWSCEQGTATALSHICGLCNGTEEKERHHHLKYPQQEHRAVATLLLRVPLCWVWLLKETIYHTNKLCTAHGCPAWQRDVCARYDPGLTEDGSEIGAGVCLVLSAVGSKCCVLKIQLTQPAAPKWSQLGVEGLCIVCLLDVANAESRKELPVNKRSRIFWKK